MFNVCTGEVTCTCGLFASYAGGGVLKNVLKYITSSLLILSLLKPQVHFLNQFNCAIIHSKTTNILDQDVLTTLNNSCLVTIIFEKHFHDL